MKQHEAINLKTKIEVKNIRTGERYVTWKEVPKTFIDGVEFTTVLHMGQPRLIRSDSLSKIAVDRNKKVA
jgi:hypothetical protein